MARSPVPIIVTGAGEGGSGGALAIAVGDKVNILENAFYSVISPEGCAAIMWRDAAKAETAATALKISAKELSEMGLVDEIVPEPDGGAHADHEATAHLLDSVLERNLLELLQLTPRQLTESRYAKFRQLARRQLEKLQEVSFEHRVEKMSCGLVVRVRASIRLGHDFIHQAHLRQLFRGNFQRSGGGLRFGGIAPHNRGAAFRRDHRIKSVFEDIDLVPDGDSQRPARTAFAGDRHDNRNG